MTQQYALASNVPVVAFFRQGAQGCSRGLPFLLHRKAEKQYARSWPSKVLVMQDSPSVQLGTIWMVDTQGGWNKSRCADSVWAEH